MNFTRADRKIPLPPNTTRSSRPARRFDLYTHFHKLVRARLFESSMRLGRADFDGRDAGADATERNETLDHVLETLDLLVDHAEKEDRHVQRVLLAYAGPVALAIEGEHGTMDVEITTLRALVVDTKELRGPDLERRGEELHTRFNLLVAAQLLHLAHEEREANAELWAHLTDREIVELHQRIIQSDPPERSAWILGQLLPVSSPTERAAMWAKAMHGPPQVVAMVRQIGERVLSAAGWAAVERRAVS